MCTNIDITGIDFDIASVISLWVIAERCKTRTYVCGTSYDYRKALDYVT